MTLEDVNGRIDRHFVGDGQSRAAEVGNRLIGNREYIGSPAGRETSTAEVLMIIQLQRESGSVRRFTNVDRTDLRTIHDNGERIQLADLGLVDSNFSTRLRSRHGVDIRIEDHAGVGERWIGQRQPTAVRDRQRIGIPVGCQLDDSEACVIIQHVGQRVARRRRANVKRTDKLTVHSNMEERGIISPGVVYVKLGA